MWAKVLKRWADVTGETKLKPSDTRVVLLGDREGTWIDDREQSEFGAYSEPWAVIHKATLFVLNLERNRAYAPRGKKCKAAALLSKIARQVEQVVKDLWGRARAAGADRTARFRGIWVATGFVALRGEKQTAQLVFFSSSTTRERRGVFRRDAAVRRRRAEEHPPPDTLPPDTMCWYTDGSYDPGDKRQVPPTAGYGAVRVRNCDGRHDPDGEHIFDMCGPMLVGAHAVEKLSCNTAELRSWVVFLRWERERGGGRPVLVRYDSKYAAMITCATWRAKCHKPLAAAAQAEWSALHKHLRGKLWMKHVKGHSGNRHNDKADDLANLGRRGESRPAAIVVD